MLRFLGLCAPSLRLSHRRIDARRSRCPLAGCCAQNAHSGENAEFVLHNYYHGSISFCVKSQAFILSIGFLAAACAKSAPEPRPATQEVPSSFAFEKDIETRLPPPVRVRGEERFFSLDERMKKHRVPAVSIAVFENYEIVWAKAYGQAADGQAATPQTLFQAASISKLVNALVAALVSAEGKLALDKPINSYLKSWQLPDNELTREQPVTAHHLLTHTAGTTVHGFAGYASGAPVPTLVQVLDGAKPANSAPVRVDQKPGKAFRYSGGGISIVQLALIDILGRPYPEIAKDYVLDLLGMNDSTYEQPLPASLLPRAAAGYRRNGEVVPTQRHVYPEMAAAGLWTTPSDLARFLAAIAKARKGDSSVLSLAIATELTSPQIPSTQPDSDIGLSLFLEKVGDQWLFGHGGANEGFRAIARASRDGGYGYVIMTNSDNGGALAGEIERALMSQPGWPGIDPPIERVPLEAAKLAKLPGRFAGDPANPFEIAVIGGRIELRLPFREPSELVPVAGGALVSTVDGSRATLDVEGRSLTITAPKERGGRKREARRLGDGARVPLLELAAGRFDEAVSQWREIAHTEPASRALNEEALNRLGYELLGEGKSDEALVLFRFITVVLPDSSNAFDSLGEAHAIRGETKLAIEAYEASLKKLNTDRSVPEEARPARRTYGEEQLKKLRAK